MLLQAARLSTYQDMKTEIENWYMATAGSNTTPMDIGAVVWGSPEGENEGKGKGDGKKGKTTGG